MSMMDVREHAGLVRHVRVAMRLAPTRGGALSTAKALAAILDEAPEVGASLAALGSEGTRVHLTIVVTLGTLQEVKTATGPSCPAVSLLHRIARDLSHADPCLVVIPDPRSREAVNAGRLGDLPAAQWPAVVRRLATVG